jgi:hypothetical protein
MSARRLKGPIVSVGRLPSDELVEVDCLALSETWAVPLELALEEPNIRTGRHAKDAKGAVVRRTCENWVHRHEDAVVGDLKPNAL